MTLESIITPMNFTLARDALCQLIANERDSQIELAHDSGASDEWIEQTLAFTVYPKRLKLPDVSDMPCVFPYINEMSFPEDRADIYENYALANFVVECYAVGKTETKTDKDGNELIIKTADENAEDRLNYLTGQIYKMLCSENSVKSGTNGLVTHFIPKRWERIITPGGDTSAGVVYGASLTFELGFNEPTYYARTQEIQEFYSTLEIRDEYIDPFVQVILAGTE
jgi:hypothetical protein